eukprot:3941057-Rhodomonas_salina.3
MPCLRLVLGALLLREVQRRCRHGRSGGPVLRKRLLACGMRCAVLGKRTGMRCPVLRARIAVPGSTAAAGSETAAEAGALYLGPRP